MQWWNDIVDWIGSDDGWRVISGAIIPFVAIVVAGIIASAAATSGAKRAIAQHNRDSAAAAVAAMIHSGRSATRWAQLPAGQQEKSDADFIAADVQLRLLALNGAAAAADWATHELGSMKRDSASFSFQAEQTYNEFRDRLLEWQRHPGRARKLFALDLERFGYEERTADAELVEQQQRWAADEAAAAATAAPAPTPTTSYDVGTDAAPATFSAPSTTALPPMAAPATNAPAATATALPVAMPPEPAPPFGADATAQPDPAAPVAPAAPAAPATASFTAPSASWSPATESADANPFVVSTPPTPSEDATEDATASDDANAAPADTDEPSFERRPIQQYGE